MSRHLSWSLFVGCISFPLAAHAQTGGSPQQPPPGYQQPPPGYQPPPPGYQQPPPGYQQPPPGYQQPPPGYQQPPPGYYAAPPQSGPPVYEPLPPPPPPKRSELMFSFRLNPLDLVLSQRFNVEIEYAFWGPLSIAIAPQYIFGDFRATNVYMTDPSTLIDYPLDLTANGAGAYAQLGVWVEGRPLRGFFLKGHAEYNRITFHSDIDNVTVPQTRFGMLFGSQTIYGGWFTLSGGIGVVYDTAAEKRLINYANPSPTGARVQQYEIAASGRLSNGWDIIAQLALGASF